MRTKPQIMPAVSGTLNITVQQLEGELANVLDQATFTALQNLLRTADLDLDWRHDYAFDRQLGESLENWKGRKPAEGTDDQDFLDMLVVDDQIGPAMGREVSDQFAKDPEWDAAQGSTKLEASSELVTTMSDWHTEAGLSAAAKDAARARWWAGRMVGRVYIPAEYADRLTGKDKPNTLADALELIHVQAIDPREGGPILDLHSRVLGYWYRYQRTGKDGQTERILEVHTPAQVLTLAQDSGGALRLDGDPADSPFQDPANPQRLRRAEYLMWHVDRDGGSCITQSVRAAQDRLNVVNTYMGRNDDQTGYRQFITVNAEQPKDAKGRPTAFPMGPGVAINLRGLKKPKTGNSTLGDTEPDRFTPTWEVVEPLSPETYHIPSINKWKSSLLEKLDQLWTLTPDVQVSGESKRQSRKPYDRRVAFAGQDAGLFIAWALRAALRLAAQIIGKVNEYRDVTFQPKMYLDVDGANLEELKVKLQMWQAGALTLVSLLEATPGVGDAAREASSVEGGSGTSPQSDAKKAALDRLAGGSTGGDQGGATS